MAILQIGWTLTPQQLAIKQGSSGAIQIQATLDNDGGVDYDGWTCRIVLLNPFTGAAAITLTPDVAGDAGAKTLTAIMAFVPETTADLAPAVYAGDVRFTAPAPSADQYFSNDLSLTIEASAS